MTINPRKIVQELQPYPAPSEDRYKAVRLDFNENTTGFPNAYPTGLEPATVSAYPEYSVFITKLCKQLNVEPDNVLLTNGSDEALLLVALTFVDAGDVAVLSKPCFTVMPTTLKLVGAKLTEVPVRRDFSFDVESIERALEGAKVAMFASPENPTGAVLDRSIITKWAKQFPNTLFVIDEAYGEYTGKSLLPMLAVLDNLLVLKTFSKAWGMAGLRLGVVFGQPRLIEFLKRVKMPYTVNSAAVATASKLLDREKEVKTAAAETMVRKERVEEKLIALGYQLVRGEANSFLLKLGTSCSAFEQFSRANGLLVRVRTCPATTGYIRVSIGTEEEMQKFFEVLEQFEKKNRGAENDTNKRAADSQPFSASRTSFANYEGN